MMNRILETTLAGLALLAMLAAAGPSTALEIERDVSIRDERGGSLTLVTRASSDALGGSGVTTATFEQFQPRDEGRIVDGEIVREHERTGDALSAVYAGTLEIRVPARASEPAQLNTLVFDDLTVLRSGPRPVLSGRVIYNGSEFEADGLPRGALRLLRRALRFFEFA